MADNRKSLLEGAKEDFETHHSNQTLRFCLLCLSTSKGNITERLQWKNVAKVKQASCLFSRLTEGGVRFQLEISTTRRIPFNKFEISMKIFCHESFQLNHVFQLWSYRVLKNLPNFVYHDDTIMHLIKWKVFTWTRDEKVYKTHESQITRKWI